MDDASNLILSPESKDVVRDVIIFTSIYAADLRDFIRNPTAKGLKRVYYDTFWKSFNLLFTLTYPKQAIRENAKYKEKITAIKLWFSRKGDGDRHCIQGLNLFDDWHGIVEEAGVQGVTAL